MPIDDELADLLPASISSRRRRTRHAHMMTRRCVADAAYAVMPQHKVGLITLESAVLA